MMATCRFDVIGSVKVIRIAGALNSAGAGQIYDDVLRAVRPDMTHVVLDLREVIDITRAGCRLINVLAKLVHTKKRNRLAVVGAPKTFRELLETSCFAHAIDLQFYDDHPREPYAQRWT